MIVELAGLPGSGKSTLESDIVGVLERQGRTVLFQKDVERESASKCFLRSVPLLYLRLWLKTIKLSWMLGRYGAPFMPSRCHVCYWFAKDLFLNRYYAERFLPPKENSNTVYLVHEGAVQHLANLCVWEDITDSGGVWDLDFPFSSIALIYLVVPPDLGFSRFWARGIPTSWPTECQERERARAAYDTFHLRLEEIVQSFESAGGSVHRVNVSPELAEVRLKLENTVSD